MIATIDIWLTVSTLVGLVVVLAAGFGLGVVVGFWARDARDLVLKFRKVQEHEPAQAEVGQSASFFE